MEDPSITKRLIDFGTDEHDYDEVQELPDESNNNNNQQAIIASNSSGSATATAANSQSSHHHNNNNNSHITPPPTAESAVNEDLPPELPPPKQKGVKNSKKSKSKSKIPRSPSLASTLSPTNSSGGSSSSNNNQTNLPPQLPLPLKPPETPPLPANFHSKAKHMNGSSHHHQPATPRSPSSVSIFSTPVAASPPTSPSASITNLNHSNAGGGSSGGGHMRGGSGGGMGGPQNNRSSLNMSASTRRGQMPISPIAESPKSFQELSLIVRKDENGYGMKVSGDNPVFVESVKPGGAAQIAGLVAGDMILKVNGQEVSSEKHPTVVSLIKASTIVELSVRRSQKMVRPTSVGITPSTPILSGRDRTASITGPQPVDSIKRREMETHKIHTLQMMLEQEKLNLERLKGDTNNPGYKRSEANIRKLREQLSQVGAEDAPPIKYPAAGAGAANNKNSAAMLSPNQLHHLSGGVSHQHQQQPPHFAHHPTHQYQHHQATTPQPQPTQSSPAFLSLLPRSLSSLSLGGRKNKVDKDLMAALNHTTDFLHTSPTPPAQNVMSQSLHQPPQTNRLWSQPQSSAAHSQQVLQQRFKDTPKSSGSQKSKHIFAAQPRNLIEEDTPPPLPQRNRPLLTDTANTMSSPSAAMPAHLSPISDLDHTHVTSSGQQGSAAGASASPGNSSGSSSSQKKQRSKAKTKALSDPKMSTHLFLQMESGQAGGEGFHDAFGASETDCVPPPLPPRQPGMLEDHANRPPPNSIDTVLNYPLVATCTPVHRDNMAAAFPLSQRINIVQQLQQHQQQQQQMAGNGGGGGIGSGSTAALGQTPHNVNNLNKHRRVVSSPDNMHPRHPDRFAKTTSGSWELVEKDGEVTPPGTPPPPYLTSHMNVSGNDSDLHDISSTSGGIFVESHHFTPLASGSTSPPPPPPQHTATTHSSRIQAAQSSTTQKAIMSMEDGSDHEGPILDEEAPFTQLKILLETDNVGYMAVFLNYVLCNSDPAPLLFYLITDLYKEGSAKDMRKWAYEIHSTFLVPRAPLSWYCQDETLAREVDSVLQNEYDKVEILRKVFWKSRKRAREIICEQLRDFQQKRTAGLGTIYGPTDKELKLAKNDDQRRIVEDTLICKLKSLIEEYEKDLPVEDPKKLALCSAVSTVIHRIFVPRSPNSIVDRVHHFVSREKSFKSRLMGKNRKMVVRGHPLVLRQYYEVTHCNHCQTIIWGVSPQGYNCTDCKLNIHRPCSKVLDENCPGPLPQAKRKEPHNDNKISKIMGKIRPRTSDFIAAEKRARHDEDADDFLNERIHSSSIVRQPSDRRPDGVNVSQRSNGNLSHNAADLQSSFHGSGGEGLAGGSSGDAAGASQAGQAGGGGGAAGGAAGGSASCAGASAAAGGANAGGATPAMNSADANAQDADGKDARRERLHQQHQQNKSAPVLVNRSESYKERISQKRNRNSRRKTSDPSLTSRPNDEQPDVGLSNSKYTASSNSSLSSAGGSESPSTSMEQVAGGSGAAGGFANASAAAHHHSHTHSLHGPHHAHQHSHQDSFHSTASSSFPAPLARQWNIDSDEDDDLNEVDWSSNVTAEMLAALTDAEKKRQEIINEIYQTERSHVRTLKLLERLFFGPLQESGILSQDHLMLLFPPALLSLRDLHSAFEQKLKQRRLEHNHVVQHVGDLLACMFDGPSAQELCDFAAQFCARQQIALEALKEKRRKDEQLAKLLAKAESHKACRRLQLKDLLPTVLQRLTKYPLLFENLYKVTIRVVPENTAEAAAIQRAVESSKKILVDVNQAVKTAEDAHKLQNIQKKLGKSELEEFKNLDLTQYRLIYDGSLEMKKNSSIQLHGLLFEDMIVLLTKQDDKYYLRNLHNNLNKIPISPIMKIDAETMVRPEAADKNTFFLIRPKASLMLDLRAPSSSECKTWFKHISDAAEQYKPRSKNANQEPVDDPALATLPHSATRESLELTPERPMAATATVSTTPLAPMMPIASVSTTHAHGYPPHQDVQMRGGHRESTPGPADGLSAAAYHKQRLSHNEMSSSAPGGGGASVNRTLSTRSYDNNHHYANNESSLNGVTLRHTQSARQANGDGATASNGAGGTSKRDSASIVYSNNSNNTRTLMQSSPPLVEPTAIQISISPAHTAEPVLTPAERLRRLDASIRDGLFEKQKIICDMFRLPVEHFHEIADIAGMPEAPKDSADIALAAYAQVQSLTEVLNDYMHATPELELLAAAGGSSSVCDQCHEKQQQRHHVDATSVKPVESSTATAPSAADVPPPLPPPNKQPSQLPPKAKANKAQQQTPSPSVTKLQTHLALDEADIHEDDDGYCEIDELRLPSLASLTSTKATPQPQMPSGSGGSQKAAAPIAAATPTAPATAAPATVAPATVAPSTPVAAAQSPTPSPSVSPPELVKRQSTISAESIPEESADEVSEAMDESAPQAAALKEAGDVAKKEEDAAPEELAPGKAEEKKEDDAEDDTKTAKTKEAIEKDQKKDEKEEEAKSEEAAKDTKTEPSGAAEEPAEAKKAEAKQDKEAEPEEAKQAAESQESSEDKAVATIIQNSLEALDTLNELAKQVTTVDNMTQTKPVALSLTTHTSWTNTNGGLHLPPCGQGRIHHASSAEPSVPCHALNSIVSALNAQISLLLPKINERDMERERLRKENQHLRELLNAMHDRQRVEAKSETPTDIRAVLSGALDAADDDDLDEFSANSTTPTPSTPAPSDEAAAVSQANLQEVAELKAAKE